MKQLNMKSEIHLMEALTIAQRFVTHGGPDVRVISNPHSEDITLINSGSTFTGHKNCYIACQCDDEGVLIGEPYIITKEVFKSNYVPKMQGALA